MIRRMIRIDPEKCNGCGACAAACHEGAIGMVNGKAVLLREDYCDGLGDCLPACPTGAIAFEEREAPAYDAAAVAANQAAQKDRAAQQAAGAPEAGVGGCPGSRAMALTGARRPEAESEGLGGGTPPAPSRLAQWPVQIRLAPVQAPFYQGTRLLVAADCCAYAHADFHGGFMEGHVTLIGCPKLDAVDYAEKLTAILSRNDIKNVTVARMEVPCCGGMEAAVRTALANSGKTIPWRVVTFATDGRVLPD